MVMFCPHSLISQSQMESWRRNYNETDCYHYKFMVTNHKWILKLLGHLAGFFQTYWFYSPYPPSNIFADLFKTSLSPSLLYCFKFNTVSLLLNSEESKPSNCTPQLPTTHLQDCLHLHQLFLLSLECSQYFFTCHLLRNLALLIINFLCSIFLSYQSSLSLN